MNRSERTLLSPLIKRVCKSYPNAWWELKRQIWDGGYQPYYPSQDEFRNAAYRALDRLDTERAASLAEQYTRQHPGTVPTPIQIREYYVHVIIEEVVKRATAAAYRTVEW